MVTIAKVQIENRTKNGFTQIDNSIIRENKTDLSIEAYIVLTKCLAHKTGWQVDWKEFEKVHNISYKKRLRALEELENKRHCIRVKWRNGKAWVHNIVFFEIPPSEEQVQEFKQNCLANLNSIQNKLANFRIHVSSGLNEIVQIECSNGDIPKGADINNTNINKTNYKNINKDKSSIIGGEVRQELTALSNTFSNINTHDIFTQDSDEIDNYSLNDKQNSDFKKVVFAEIDKDFQIPEINELFKYYVSCLNDIGKNVTIPYYKLLKKQLDKRITDADKIEILKIGISYGSSRLDTLLPSREFYSELRE